MSSMVIKHNARLLCVGSPAVHERLAQLAGPIAKPPVRCETVYDALVRAIGNQQQAVKTLALISVDALDDQEMHVFSTLAQLPELTVWAVSRLDKPEQKKFQQARAAGAVETIGLADHSPDARHLADKICQWFTPNPPQDEVTQPPEVQTPAPEKIEQAPECPVEPEQKIITARQPEPTNKTTGKETDKLELITDEELEALLGPSQADEL